MPGFSGHDALRIVRAHAPHLPFIFVSGTIGEDVAVAALHEGANDYILKHSSARLPAAVDRALREARTEAERARVEAELMRTQRLESLSLLAAGLSHDLRNILQPLLIVPDLIAQRSDDPRLRQLATVVAECGRRGHTRWPSRCSRSCAVRAGPASGSCCATCSMRCSCCSRAACRAACSSRCARTTPNWRWMRTTPSCSSACSTCRSTRSRPCPPAAGWNWWRRRPRAASAWSWPIPARAWTRRPPPSCSPRSSPPRPTVPAWPGFVQADRRGLRWPHRGVQRARPGTRFELWLPAPVEAEEE